MTNQTHESSCRRGRLRGFEPRWDLATAQRITDAVAATYEDKQGINHVDGTNLPEREETLAILDLIMEVLFPGYTGRSSFTRAGLQFTVGDHINRIYRRLRDQIERAYAYRCQVECCESCDCPTQAEEATIALLERLPEIRALLKTDVRAAFDGDPAAQSLDEIVISYPCILAIAAQRVAHELYARGVPLLPRVMGEYAHSSTGIDIHPGATIGRSFFIDHGTGVVVGETAVIGDSVKVYQGVTLGALSFPKDERGKLIKGAKRHPNIEDSVTIYAGATILGDITIGHHSVIGGNVWLTESVPPHTKVTIAPPELSIRTRSSKTEPGT
jgi:serine O-acetyltransferase